MGALAIGITSGAIASEEHESASKKQATMLPNQWGYQQQHAN